MKDLDQEIREALAAEDRELLEEIGADPSLPERVVLTLRGRSRPFVILSVVAGIAFLGLLVFTGIRFYEAPTVREQLLWGAGVFYALLIILGIKVWYWMEMNQAALIREVKRLELQVALLARRLPGPNDAVEGAGER
ncbi:MAG: DUF6768 family protein [Planctomycetota bacterium]